MRPAVGVCGVVLVGCTFTVGGSAEPASDLGREPQPVPVSALDGLLLPVADVNSIMGSTGLHVSHRIATMIQANTAANDCAGTWNTAFSAV